MTPKWSWSIEIDSIEDQKTHLGSFDLNDSNDSLVFQYNVYCINKNIIRFTILKYFSVRIFKLIHFLHGYYISSIYFLWKKVLWKLKLAQAYANWKSNYQDAFQLFLISLKLSSGRARTSRKCMQHTVCNSKSISQYGALLNLWILFRYK